MRAVLRRSRTHAHATPHRAPARCPAQAGKRRGDGTAKEEPQTRMGGFSNAPRCPASLTFRDSPALVRQESDGYPVRPVLLPRRRPPIPPSSFPPRMLRTPTSRPTLGLCPARSRPSAPHTHPGPTCTYKTNPASCSQKKRKNGKEETSGGDSPPMQHPREGLPSPKLCLSITPKPAAAQGALGAACRTAAARG